LLIHIIDLGINNLTSVERAFSNLDDVTRVSVVNGENARSISEQADIVVLPGLGNFGAAAQILSDSELPTYIDKQLTFGSTLVGICLGMQLLGSSSDESEGSQGLGLIEGTSKLLPSHQNERIPHVGWGEVIPTNVGSYESLSSNRDFYFTHSYIFHARDPQNVFTTTPYGRESFTSSIKKANILGFQFHPEKSGKAGKDLIAEIVKSAK
jgi:glutamine amidotransferase